MTDFSIAVIGQGGMGSGIALRLLDSAVPVTVYNRTRHKTDAAAAAGATVATSIATAVSSADIVILSLADEAAIEQVVFGPGGVAAHLAEGGCVADTSTASPAFARACAERLAEKGLHFIEARLMGNHLHARSGELKVFTAGAQDVVATVRPVLEVLGQEVRQLGDVGTAATFKLSFNIMLGAQLAAMSEAVAYAQQAGLPRDVVLHAIGNSGLSSPAVAFRCGLALQRKFDPPAFRTRLMHRDLQVALSDTSKPMPVIESTAEYFDAAVAAGLGELDSAVVLREPTASAPPAPAAAAVQAPPADALITPALSLVRAGRPVAKVPAHAEAS